jgi:hypothetical protein
MKIATDQQKLPRKENRLAYSSQPDYPNIQLDAMYAAEKAAARQESERTRKKLMEAASKLAGESGEASIVEIGAREESREESNERRPAGYGRLEAIKGRNGFACRGEISLGLGVARVGSLTDRESLLKR